jgi:hypothetical protein
VANLEKIERLRDNNKDLEFSCCIYIYITSSFPMLMPQHSGWKKKQLFHMPMFQPEEKLVNTKSKKWKRGD